MKTRFVASLLVAAFVAGCASTPTWNTDTFPHQVNYDMQSSGASPGTAPVTAKN